MDNTIINKLFFIITFLILSFNYTYDSAVAKSPDLLYVGVLEVKPANWGDSVVYKYDTMTKKIVRVLFYKTAKGWESLENKIDSNKFYPRKESWTIAFDGKNLGHIKSKAVPVECKWGWRWRWTLPRDAHHKPISKILPSVGKPTFEFSGEPGFFVPRPLIVVSKENFKAPEKWKPFSPNKKLINKIKQDYKNYINNNFKNDSVDMSKLSHLKSYKSDKGDALIQVCIMKRAYYDDYEYEGYRTWYYLAANGNYRNLTKMIDYYYRDTGQDDSSMNLVDAGDYDGDNKSEVVFWVSRYVNDGYVIFYNNFTKYAKFDWDYH